VIERYDWAGGREAMLRFGPADGPLVLFAMPLFEEANRTRAFVVSMLRALAGQGIASLLPDLPGTGESLTELEEVSASDWTEAFSAASGSRPCHVAALRGGCLIAGNVPALSRWYFAPATGETVVRDLIRARQIADREEGGRFDADEADRDGPPIELAGNRVPRPLLRALREAEPDEMPPCRIVRLDGDPHTADRHVPGTPLWRRSEPDNDPELAALLAEDLAAWIERCAS
jgi:pimeloyl-ACP methyl ester carboxylesterase